MERAERKIAIPDEWMDGFIDYLYKLDKNLYSQIKKGQNINIDKSRKMNILEYIKNVVQQSLKYKEVCGENLDMPYSKYEKKVRPRRP